VKKFEKTKKTHPPASEPEVSAAHPATADEVNELNTVSIRDSVSVREKDKENIMETAKVDIRKLQLLNDRISQTIDALHQVRLSVQGLSHSADPRFGIPGVVPGAMPFVPGMVPGVFGQGTFGQTGIMGVPGWNTTAIDPRFGFAGTTFGGLGHSVDPRFGFNALGAGAGAYGTGIGYGMTGNWGMVPGAMTGINNYNVDPRFALGMLPTWGGLSHSVDPRFGWNTLGTGIGYNQLATPFYGNVWGATNVAPMHNAWNVATPGFGTNVPAWNLGTGLSHTDSLATGIGANLTGDLYARTYGVSPMVANSVLGGLSTIAPAFDTNRISAMPFWGVNTPVFC
jgi:hypothetical protein